MDAEIVVTFDPPDALPPPDVFVVQYWSHDSRTWCLDFWRHDSAAKSKEHAEKTHAHQPYRIVKIPGAPPAPADEPGCGADAEQASPSRAPTAPPG